MVGKVRQVCAGRLCCGGGALDERSYLRLVQLPYQLATTDEDTLQYQCSMPLSHPAAIATPLSLKVREGKRKLSLRFDHFVREGAAAARG